MFDVLRPSDPPRLFYAPACAVTRCRRRAPIRSLPAAHGDSGFPFPQGLSTLRTGTDRSGPAMRVKLAFASASLSASERCIRVAHRLVPPIQPAARQTLRIVDRAARQDQDTELLTQRESYFSTTFLPKLWGKDKAEFSIACQIFRKTTAKLFAGISTRSHRSSAFFCARGAMSCSRSRTPQRSFRDFKLSSKA